jgi:hypothetical protein
MQANSKSRRMCGGGWRSFGGVRAWCNRVAAGESAYLPVGGRPLRAFGHRKQTILFRPYDGSRSFPAIVILPSGGGIGSHI